MNTIKFLEQDQILQFESIAEKYLLDILGIQVVMLSDLSDLSDFTFSGNMPEDLLTEDMSLEELYTTWDEWVIGKTYDEYGITLLDTNISLIALCNRISEKQHARLH
jgi:hypothetical protein